MRRFYYESEMKDYSKIDSWPRFFSATLVKVVSTLLFFAGIALLPPLIMVRRVLLDGRIRFLVVCVGVVASGMTIEIFLLPHYLAPITAAFYAIGLQAMRHLRVWSPEGRPVGATLVRLTVALCFMLGTVRVFAGPLGLKVQEWPPNHWLGMWYGPDIYGTERAHIQAELENLPGRQLAFVRDSPRRDPLDQWVYNQPDIDASKVVWAWDMDPANNQELMRYYPDRKAWLIQMDSQPATVSPYTPPAQLTGIAH
jgi:hypothetical protein